MSTSMVQVFERKTNERIFKFINDEIVRVVEILPRADCREKISYYLGLIDGLNKVKSLLSA